MVSHDQVNWHEIILYCTSCCLHLFYFKGGFIKIKTVLIALFVFLLNTGFAQACLGPSSEVHTFFESLFQRAFEKDVIALVKIERTTEKDMFRESLVKVVQPIRNTQQGQEFVIKEPMHSCMRPYDIAIGNTFFIAGEFNEENNFTGEWKSENTGIW